MYHLIGPYPPPIGGISVFISRYEKVLKKKGEHPTVIDFPGYSSIQRLLYVIKIIFSPHHYIFHLNGVYFLVMTALLLRPWKCRIIFHDHSTRFIDEFDGKRKFVFQKFLKKTNKIILVGEHLKANYEKNGYKLPENITVKNSFLAPPHEDEESIRDSYSTETKEFIKDHEPIIIANASGTTFYKGTDLYGLDMCIELASRLKEKYPKAGLLYAIAQVQDQHYFEKMKDKVEELKVSEHFHFMSGNKELWPLFKDADLMIRPSATDSFGISVAEALSLGCPAIASDVCKRPEGTTIFKSRNLNDLEEKCLNALGRK